MKTILHHNNGLNQDYTNYDNFSVAPSFEVAWDMLMPISSSDWYKLLVDQRTARLESLYRQAFPHQGIAQDQLEAREDNKQTDDEIVNYLKGVK